MVYYRKYRPQKIVDLDNTAVRELLLSIFSKTGHSSADTIPHAFLFTGPKGLGKTSAARIIAKAVNCEENAARQVDPCNVCDQCVSITNGTNLDVLEIDAASNRGIDEIRDLKEKIRLAPVASRKKVYIIDEVHMLTTEAFNALLKTLEEPPEHAMFVLCTTEPHKVPATIISRCFHIHFNLATEDEIVHSLKRIVDGEKLHVDDEALHAIAKIADGGFRDGSKILEELTLLASGQKITKEFFEGKYQVSGMKHQVSEMFRALAKKDLKKSLEIVQKVVEQGADIKYFLQGLLQELHNRLLLYAGIQKQELGGKEQELSIEDIKELFALFSKAYSDMRYTVLPQLPLELTIIEYCQLKPSGVESIVKVQMDSLPSPSTVVRQISRDESREDAVTVASLRKQVGVMQKSKALYGTPAKQDSQEGNAEKKMEITKIELMKALANGEVTKEWQDALWRSIISEMKQYNHTVAGVLRSCGIKHYDKKQLIIETAYAFHKERLESMQTQEALAKVCKVLTGNDMKIAVELKK